MTSVLMRRLAVLQDLVGVFEVGLSTVGCDFLGEFRQCIEFGPDSFAEKSDSTDQTKIIPDQIG